MRDKRKAKGWVWAAVLLLAGCATLKPVIPVEKSSVAPGSQVSRAGHAIHLIGTPIGLAQPLPAVSLVDAMSMGEVDLSAVRGQVLLLSIVPSLDTPVCDAQTHYLGEQGDRLPVQVRRVVISRDTPFAQKRFATSARLTDLQYLSDHREGAFGRSTGLLMERLGLLARSVILVDREGIVRYIQVVPDITRLPDMEEAFRQAVRLVADR